MFQALHTWGGFWDMVRYRVNFVISITNCSGTIQRLPFPSEPRPAHLSPGRCLPVCETALLLAPLPVAPFVFPEASTTLP